MFRSAFEGGSTGLAEKSGRPGTHSLRQVPSPCQALLYPFLVHEADMALSDVCTHRLELNLHVKHPYYWSCCGSKPRVGGSLSGVT